MLRRENEKMLKELAELQVLADVQKKEVDELEFQSNRDFEECEALDEICKDIHQRLVIKQVCIDLFKELKKKLMDKLTRKTNLGQNLKAKIDSLKAFKGKLEEVIVP